MAAKVEQALPRSLLMGGLPVYDKGGGRWGKEMNPRRENTSGFMGTASYRRLLSLE